MQRRKTGHRPDTRNVTSPKKSNPIYPVFSERDKTPSSSGLVHSFSADTQPHRSVKSKRKLEAQSPMPAGPIGSHPLVPNFSFVVNASRVISPLFELQSLSQSPPLPYVNVPSSGNRSSSTKGKSKNHRHGIIRPTLVGHFSQGKNNGSSSGDVRPHQSHFDSHSRVVRSRTHDSLEEHLPTDHGEPASGISSVLQSRVARVAEPMVGVLDGSSSTKSGEDLSVANATFNFGKTSLVRIESFRRDNRAPNASGSTDCCVLSGQQSNQEIDPSIPSKFAGQSHGLSEGDAHGSYGAHNNSNEREWCH